MACGELPSAVGPSEIAGPAKSRPFGPGFAGAAPSGAGVAVVNPRRRPVSKLKTAVIASLLLALTAVLVVVFVLRLAQSPDAKVQLGDEVFEVGRVRELAPPIDRDGPLLFQDLLGRDRDLYVQHIGDDAAKGWLAFEAHAPGQPRECALRWIQDRGLFEDACTKTTYSVDGKGLTHYPADVRRKSKGGLVLFVDLRTPLPSG